MTDIQRELRQAHADFEQTSLEIKRRLDVGERSLERQVKQNPIRAVLISAGLGLVIGRASRSTAVLLALLGGVAVGYSVAVRRPEGHGGPSERAA